jgi:anti-anti-sigma factor
MDTSVARFEVTQTEIDGLAGVVVAGEVDGVSCGELASALARAARRGGPVVLDLGNCTFIDSSAVGVIARAVKGRKNGGGLVICDPNRFVSMVLAVTGVDGMPGVRRGYKDSALIGGNGAGAGSDLHLL